MARWLGIGGRFRRLAVAMLLGVLAGGPAAGAPLRDRPVRVVQPDGTEWWLLVSGDEYRQRVHDARGFTVVRDPTGWWVYGAEVGGRLVPTVLAVGQADPERMGLSPQAADAPQTLVPWLGAVPRPPRVPSPSRAPDSGTPTTPSLSPAPLNPAPRRGVLNNLVVFVRFSDQAEFGQPIGVYDGLMNGPGLSMWSYFREVSYQQLAIQSSFFPVPSGGYVVSYQDPYPRSYYEPYDPWFNPGGYQGGADGSQRIEREQALVARAVTAIAGQVPAELNIDADADGYVDSVVLVVQGAYGSWAELLWPHRWSLYLYEADIRGKRVWDFNLQLSSWIELGVLCHEMFHTLGAPDLYHYSLDGRTPVGPWDLMEGTFPTPQHMGAYMKYRYGGWIPALRQVVRGRFTLNDVTSPVDNHLLVAAPGSSTEYFFLEYRRRTGSYETSLPGTGLLAYRVNPSLSGNSEGPPDEVYVFRPGGTPSAEGTIENAVMAQDYGRTDFSAGRNPYPFLSSGAPGGIRVFDIGATGTTISFRVCTIGAACDAGSCGFDGCVDCGACPDDGNPCTVESCVDGTCRKTPAADGTGCDDGNACTRTDRCVAGVCTGGNPVTCEAQDACHVAGRCDPATGVCTNPPAADGTGCDDGDACTRTDRCVAGVCTGGNPVTCEAQDACHVAGRCDPATGVCTNPPAADGTGCDDGDACTRTDRCVAGGCTGGDPVTCVAQDACHVAGWCEPATGACTNPPAADGTGCDDGDACTRTDRCVAGVCTGGDPVTCVAQDACHVAGWCEPATGACTNPPAADGTGCDDGDACTRTDRCREGVCIGWDPVACEARDACHLPGLCDPATGTCTNPPATDGTGCDDGDACTRTDRCVAGVCTGGNPVTCMAQDACHVAGRCDPATGTCTNPPATDGTGCDDGNPCTRSDACRDGICVGEDLVMCLPASPCHVAGTCDPGTGTCTSPFAEEGTECDDGDPCTREDSCDGRGLCVGVHDPACDPEPTPEAPGPEAPDTPSDVGTVDLPDQGPSDLSGGSDAGEAGPDGEARDLREPGPGQDAVAETPGPQGDPAGEDVGPGGRRTSSGCGTAASEGTASGVWGLLGLGLLLVLGRRRSVPVPDESRPPSRARSSR